MGTAIEGEGAAVSEKVEEEIIVSMVDDVVVLSEIDLDVLEGGINCVDDGKEISAVVEVACLVAEVKVCLTGLEGIGAGFNTTVLEEESSALAIGRDVEFPI